MTPYQQLIHVSRYARFLPELGRRETWHETVQRYISYFKNRIDSKNYATIDKLAQRIESLDVMPSMRALMSAGGALDNDNLAGYNCAYLAVNYQRAFSEALYILMNGTGVGFSCERQEIAKLPAIASKFKQDTVVIKVGDSKKGWSVALESVINRLYRGVIPIVDYSAVRPHGSPLKTFGGRASGPEPLKRLFKFCEQIFIGAAGRKLESLEVHDIMCMIGNIVIVGGVRRSALISLSNLSDLRMRNAKTGQWWVENPQRALANNSVAYNEKPSIGIFLDEWKSLYESKSGERGIFNRASAQKQASKWGRRDPNADYGVNPCGEIILKSNQLCNLSEVIIKANDTPQQIKDKVRDATILGTLQATLTEFDFLNEEWESNTINEALLGVSLTGIMDNPYTNGANGFEQLKFMLNELRDHARAVNLEWSKILGINPAAAITCVKPSGTVSQLCDTASGIHPRHSGYYLRRVRLDKKDPICKMLVSQGVELEDDLQSPNTTIVSFPQRAPVGAFTRNEVSALSQLELWKIYHDEWCEHNPSITVNVRESEWLDVAAWVYKHFDDVSGVAFLPHSDHIYEQAPYQDLTRDEFFALKQPVIDWSKLSDFEKTDETLGAQTLACTAGGCEL